MVVVNPSYLRAQTLTLCACDDDGSTQFNAYQNSFFEKGQSLVEN